MAGVSRIAVPSRPVLRYHGGKWKLAPWILSHMPPHRIYTEPFGGGGSVLLRKPRAYGEVYNDLDAEVVNVFRVLQDPARAEVLRRRLELTPFARAEFRAAYEPTDDPVEAAARLVVRSFMGFGSASVTRTHITGFRSNSNRAGTTPAQDWGNWPWQVPAFVDRLRGVVIENRDALEVIAQHDGEDTLHYVDPPYVHATRSSLSNRNGNLGHYYKHELDDAAHVALIETLKDLKGMVLLSAYPHEIYTSRLGGWTMLEREHLADGARRRREVLWLSPRAADAQRQGDLCP